MWYYIRPFIGFSIYIHTQSSLSQWRQSIKSFLLLMVRIRNKARRRIELFDAMWIWRSVKFIPLQVTQFLPLINIHRNLRQSWHFISSLGGPPTFNYCPPQKYLLYLKSYYVAYNDRDPIINVLWLHHADRLNGSSSERSLAPPGPLTMCVVRYAWDRKVSEVLDINGHNQSIFCCYIPAVHLSGQGLAV